jgi:hypothetical protein
MFRTRRQPEKEERAMIQLECGWVCEGHCKDGDVWQDIREHHGVQTIFEYCGEDVVDDHDGCGVRLAC